MSENIKTVETENLSTKDKIKKVIKIVFKSFEAIYVTLMFAFSVLIIVAGSNKGAELNSIPITNHTLLTVKTDSMKGEFDEDALVIAKVPKSNKEILSLRAKEVDPDTGKVIYEGDIISFKAIINGQEAINTHRIIAIKNPGNIDDIRFVTKGDNAPDADPNLIAAHQVLAVYVTSVPEIGGLIAGMKDNYTFIWVVIVPLALLFIYNMFVFIRNMSELKAEKLIAEKGAALSEEEKEALRQEYLKSLEKENKE